MTDKIVVLTTTDSRERAGQIARHLVETRTAACVTVVAQARSVYRWKGAIEDAEEWLLVIKSGRQQFDRLRAELERVHNYDLPEIIALPIIDGGARYLEWVAGELQAVD